MKKIDFHVHIYEDIPLEDSANYYKDMCARKGYEGVGLMALWHNSDGFHRDCNERALKLKGMIPNSYAFAAIDRERDLVEQAEEYMKNGFDGIKLFEGKPSEYMIFGWGYEDERFDRFFEYAEGKQIPIMLHNNDPIENWDMSKATPRAIEKGWVYDETVPTQEWFFRALEDALDKHRNLKIAIAHLGFYADDLDRAEALLEKCPNLYFDITPALPIYVDLCKDPARSEAFFRRYHERLTYGTDASNELVGAARDYNDTKTEVIKTFLEGSEPRQIGKYFVTPIKLEPYMLENIYYNNAIRFLGK